MKCPYCRQPATDIFNTRATKFGTQVWRRRRCLSCQATFTTYEAADLGFIQVTTGRRKTTPYSRAKLYASLHAAFEGRADQDTIDAVTDTVEAKLLDKQTTKLSPGEIAETVLQTLKRINTAAFVRYLSDRTDLASEAVLRKELKKY